ncbi:MAG: hypothetical protein KKB51_15460 [Candidatus Riflebacteria bacterium]|nr:hypothetical protein [Candidatus Riflebacteria bacterium]
MVGIIIGLSVYVICCLWRSVLAFSRQKITALLVVVLFYGLFYLNWYWSTPLGITPVLDGAENMGLAEKIYQGALPAEPFYRAMLYPFLLAILRFVGVEPDLMMSVAGIMGLFFHVLTTLLVALIAQLLWKSETSAILAGAIYGFYPLAVYFAADPLDISAAIFCMCSGLYLYLRNFDQASKSSGLAAGLAIGIGGLLRANVLAAGGLFAADLLFRGQRRKALLAILGVLLMTSAGALVGWYRSGEFRLMPWQGAFAFYVSNSATANGKYFNQTLYLPDRDFTYNPARLESEILYGRETGESGAFSIDKFNTFWRDKTLRYIRENPGQWLGLQLRKLYYLLNNFEQYNNKTYAFHRDMAPLLRYNPLCWGVVLIAVLLVLFNLRSLSPELKRILLTIFFMAAGTMVFLVSARFRLLLVPMLVVIVPGLLNLRLFERQKIVKNLVVAAIAAFVTFSTLFGAADISTFNSDRMLLAHASARLFDFAGQVYWADQTLRDNSDNLVAMRVKVVGFTNLVLSGKKGSAEDWQMVSKELSWLAEHDLQFPDTAFLSGCYALKFHQNREKAIQIWQKGLNSYSEKDLYLAALVYIGARKLSVSLDAPSGTLLWYLKIREGLLPQDNPELFKQMQRAARFFFESD